MKSNYNKFPIIILYEPQLDENIGAVARAMLNFNFLDLRIVKKKKWKPNKVTYKNSAKADEVLKNVKIFNNLEKAIDDLEYVYATSNRKRDLNIDVINLKNSIKKINKYKDYKIGILFGPERTGLKNEQISLCDKIIEIPLNKNFNSLNLAQSVLLVVYEIYNSNIFNTKLIKKIKKTKKKELFNFFKVLEFYLEKNNFFKVQEKKKLMLRNIRIIFNKAKLTEKEMKILLGIVKNLNK